MKIIRLTAENVKKLRVVDITPKGNIIQITGENGSGKTSVLDSIWWTLGGKDGIQSVPLRTGEKKGRARLDLGEFIAERKFTPTGTTITVMNSDGSVYPSPQKMLDALLGELSFDPLSFSRMASRSQFDELRRVSKLDLDIDELEALNKADFAKRTEINRNAKTRRAQAEGILVPAGTPAEPIDEGEFLNKIQAAGEHNATIENRKARREQAQRDASDKKAEGVRLRERSALAREQASQRIADLQRQMERLEKDAFETAADLDKRASVALNAAGEIEKKIDESEPLPAPISVTELRSALDAAKVTNANVARKVQRNRIAAEAKELETQADALTKQMEDRNASKEKGVQSAEMPVPGLGFGDGLVTYRGLPFDQASDAEQLRVSVSIAMAANPKLRVIRIKDGSLLDTKSMALLSEMAVEKDYQIWIERVDDSGKIGIVMEDGEVASDNQQEAPSE